MHGESKYALVRKMKEDRLLRHRPSVSWNFLAIYDMEALGARDEGLRVAIADNGRDIPFL